MRLYTVDKLDICIDKYLNGQNIFANLMSYDHGILIAEIP